MGYSEAGAHHLSGIVAMRDVVPAQVCQNTIKSDSWLLGNYAHRLRRSGMDERPSGFSERGRPGVGGARQGR